MQTGELNARIVKIIGTRYPRLRKMIRNHPYTKIVGAGIIKCLTDDMGMQNDEIDDALLEAMVDRGIALYHEREEQIQQMPVLEHKRKLLCEDLKQTATQLIAAG